MGIKALVVQVVLVALIFLTIVLELRGDFRLVEQDVGSNFLFRLRNVVSPPAIPSNLLIVTPFLKRSIDQPDALTDWDRAIHGEALRQLRSLKAGVIAIDIYFRNRSGPGDLVLADEISANQHVILNQLARSISKEDDTAVYLRNPSAFILHNDALLAPSMVRGEGGQVQGYYPLYPFVHDYNDHHCYGYPADSDLSGNSLQIVGKVLGSEYVATFPFIVLEQQLIRNNELSEFLNLYFDESITDHSFNDCSRAIEIRKRISSQISVIDSFETTISPGLRSWLKTVKHMSFDKQINVQGIQSLKLNFFGPPRSITTIDYETLARLEYEVRNGHIDNPIEDSVVFIGGSFLSTADMKEDSFQTTFSSLNDPMSGVEIAATAYANLLTDTHITFTNSHINLLSYLILGSLVLIMATYFRGTNLVVAALGLIVTYLYFAGWLFITMNQASPIVVPVSIVALLSSCAILNQYSFSEKRRKKLNSTLEQFLGEKVFELLGSANNQLTHQAICMVTDVQGFTSIGSRLKPTELHKLNEKYFELIFGVVTKNGAEVIKTYGDSMTAIWLNSNDTNPQHGIDTGLELLKTVEIFNSENTEKLPTRIGLAMGDVVIGLVGDGNRQTVEITGATVYLASRLEQFNKMTKTNFMVADCFRQFLADYDTTCLDEVKLSGIHEPIPAHIVHGRA